MIYGIRKELNEHMNFIDFMSKNIAAMAARQLNYFSCDMAIPYKKRSSQKKRRKLERKGIFKCQKKKR